MVGAAVKAAFGSASGTTGLLVIPAALLATLSLGSCRASWCGDVSVRTPIIMGRLLVRWDDGIYPDDALYYYGGKCGFAMVLLLRDGVAVALWSGILEGLQSSLLCGLPFGRLGGYEQRTIGTT